MELTLSLDDSSKRAALFGSADRNLRLIRGALGVGISARNSTIHLSGDSKAVGKAAAVIEQLQEALRQQDHVTEEDVVEAIAQASTSVSTGGDGLEVYGKNCLIVPKTEGQKRYVEAMDRSDLVFCTGPAGSGKTYLAVAKAVSLLKAGRIKRIVLVRPAVEAGEKLGYLPGDLQAKVNPYLRPLFDAMHDMMSYEQIQRFMQNDIIEVIPLAFMRGRTLNNAAVILDEAQNTTVSQMLMFLTRLGHNSQMIVTGDDSQVDLGPGQESGLVDANRRLQGVAGMDIIRLDRADIVRHPLVQRIVNAYGNGAAESAGGGG